jgi:galactokinase/mevalonate kinase-like predicted kinase
MRRRQPLSLRDSLTDRPVIASAPCRIDCGGTWDLKAFSLPYHHLEPATVNIALDIRTNVRLSAHEDGWTRVISRGFKPEVFQSMDAPFTTPLGFVFAVATYFNVTGVQIDIDSASPPRSALGGSGVVGVALIHAFCIAMLRFGKQPLTREATVKLASAIEDGLSISLCGMQDQAAAAFGGVNKWTWNPDGGLSRDELISVSELNQFGKNLLVAYCGSTHNSVDVNARWIHGFASGRHRGVWFEINDLTTQLAEELRHRDWSKAAHTLARETELRRTLTPEVLVGPMELLIQAAELNNCGARFTGAGGGGCVWALGEKDDIRHLEPTWLEHLARVQDARLLPSRVDGSGVREEYP